MIFVDAHVHIHKCFDLESLVDAAYENFLKHARNLEDIEKYFGVLMLTESAGTDEFEKLAAIAESIEQNIGDHWKLNRCEESCSIVLSRDNVDWMIIIAGRQIVTAENLEVLALGTRQEFMDGIPVIDLVKAVRKAGAVAVIPWGVGKWLGGRGDVLSRVLTSDAQHGLYLGDNGGRPVFWRDPSHFQQAREAGIRILPGSDPLPLPSEVHRVGSFGFTLRASISTTHPARDIRCLLQAPDVEIKPYGQLQGPFQFIRNQISLRLVRSPRSAEAS
jgi:hypothetical protein